MRRRRLVLDSNDNVLRLVDDFLHLHFLFLLFLFLDHVVELLHEEGTSVVDHLGLLGLTVVIERHFLAGEH